MTDFFRRTIMGAERGKNRVHKRKGKRPRWKGKERAKRDRLEEACGADESFTESGIAYFLG